MEGWNPVRKVGFRFSISILEKQKATRFRVAFEVIVERQAALEPALVAAFAAGLILSFTAAFLRLR